MRYLKLTNWSSKNFATTQLLVERLKNFPIQTLVLEIKKCIFYSGDDEWTEQFSLEGTFHHLKSVKIRNLMGCQNELKFLEFLVKNFMFLKKIVIRAASISSKYQENELINFTDKLQLLSKAFPNVGISFISKKGLNEL
ncbi:hypothetical protein AQUCO_01400663v1 [Aquilegia coerulea]|uniref:FBD domain-containing protein n=1 Tax=Aquilegia coerulea TaxID=218851 RepID=A0A2G5DXI0_AQUCA|nr:hypothetical protein AQUCO_01400663v1 [Aquilegia coerulea]